jgi:hypothetical protein
MKRFFNSAFAMMLTTQSRELPKTGGMGMQTISHIRQHITQGFARSPFRILAGILLASITLAATPSQAGVSWDYRLLGKLNSAQDPSNGLTIMITGSGSFDLSSSSINGGGSYTILDAGGSVIGSGAWTAATFDSFMPLVPGGSPGEGGRLELEASFNGTGRGALNGSQRVVIQCSMWGTKDEPPGYPWPADFVEVGPYTLHRTGGVMFNLNQ